LTGLSVLCVLAGIFSLGVVDLTPVLAPSTPEGASRPSSPKSETDTYQSVPVIDADPAVAPQEQAIPNEEQDPSPEPPGSAPAVETGKGVEPEDDAGPFSRRMEGASVAGMPRVNETADPLPSDVRYPWSILLASFKEQDRAERALETYRDRSIQAYWVPVDLQEQGVWYRVFTGHFSSRKEAAAFLKTEGLEGAQVKSTRFASLAGVFRDKRVSAAMEERLRAMGWRPYGITKTDGGHRLYAGTFYTMEGAEALCVELRSRGLECQAVER